MADIELFFSAKTYAVAGASRDRSKYGNKVLRALLYEKHDVVGIHPTEQEVEGAVVYPSLDVVPQTIESLSIVTPPAVTRQVVADAIAADVKNIWMQPGAEDAMAIRLAEENGVNVIADGPCVLVELARRSTDSEKS